MAETASQKSATPRNEPVQGRRKEVVGEVVANRMQKTIVVKVTRKKAHPFYGRVVARNKKFYAHDEKNEAHVGDVVRIEETRPLSKLKRWKLKDIVRKTTLVPEIALQRDDKGQAKSQSKGPGKDKSKSKTKSE